MSQEGLSVEALEREIHDHALPFEQTVSLITSRILKDARRNTWFASPQELECFATTRGSRPGSPVADIADNVLMTSILRELQPLARAHPQILKASSLLGMEVPISLPGLMM